MTKTRTAPNPDPQERGTATLQTNPNGTIGVVGPVPRIVEMSRELFMDWVFELNEHRREPTRCRECGHLSSLHRGSLCRACGKTV
jgi:hypothetical protein